MAKCEWVTCNSRNDYEYDECQQEATHRVSWPDGASEIFCEVHTSKCREIMEEMSARSALKVKPEIDRLIL